MSVTHASAPELVRVCPRQQEKTNTGESAPLASYEILGRYRLEVHNGANEQRGPGAHARISEIDGNEALGFLALSGPRDFGRTIDTAERAGVGHRISLRRNGSEASVEIEERGSRAAWGRWSPIFFGQRPVDVRLTFTALMEDSLHLQVRALDAAEPSLSVGIRVTTGGDSKVRFRRANLTRDEPMVPRG